MDPFRHHYSVGRHQTRVKLKTRDVSDCSARQNRRQFGAIRIELGNLRLCRTAWWAREMSHVGPDQILTQGAGRNGRFEAKQGFGIYPNPSLPRLARGGRRFKILPLRPPHPTLSAAVTASPKANRGARLPTSRA